MIGEKRDKFKEKEREKLLKNPSPHNCVSHGV